MFDFPKMEGGLSTDSLISDEKKQLKLLEELVKKLDYEKTSMMTLNENLLTEMKELGRELARLQTENSEFKSKRSDGAVSSETREISEKEVDVEDADQSAPHPKHSGQSNIVITNH